MFGVAIRSFNRRVRSPSRPNAEQFDKARFVRIAQGAFPVWLDPFGMLDPQIIVNLLPKLGIGVDLVRHSHWLGERLKGGVGRFV